MRKLHRVETYDDDDRTARFRNFLNGRRKLL